MNTVSGIIIIACLISQLVFMIKRHKKYKYGFATQVGLILNGVVTGAICAFIIDGLAK